HRDSKKGKTVNWSVNIYHVKTNTSAKTSSKIKPSTNSVDEASSSSHSGIGTANQRRVGSQSCFG
ncbi:MAG: hypothetical protein AAF193_07415, partial [Bacteroidota bacterium]